MLDEFGSFKKLECYESSDVACLDRCNPLPYSNSLRILLCNLSSMCEKGSRRWTEMFVR